MFNRLSTIAAVALSLLLFLDVPVRAQLEAGDLVAICGDSITEQKQYSVFVQTYLLACQPQPELRAMQFGWGGETSWGFAGRVEEDVLRFRPTVATTCYGMNDGGYAPLTEERAHRYRAAMTGIVRTLKAGGVRLVVVGSPGVVDRDMFRKDPAAAEMYNHTLAQVRDIAREVARAEQAAFADVHAAMMEVMTQAKRKYGPDYHVAGADGVHPSANGHLVMAYAFLKALGCDGEIGTITVDLAGGTAEASAGHRIIESSGGTIAIQSQRYAFCFSGDASSPASTRGVLEFVPFNQELNRFHLIVKNAPAPRMKVTWGDASGEFSADELEKGVNLAAEFPDNPFSGPLQAVQDAVLAQQNFETMMIKQHFPSLRLFRELRPDDAPAFDRAAAALMQRSGALQQAARDRVQPLRHTIVIEPVR